MPLRSLLVDDERLARVQLRSQIEHFPELQIVAEADSAKSALDALRRFTPDLVFLDIQMPGATGFDFLERAAAGNFKVIFVTAFDEFAARAFEVNALDYLLKPVRRDRLAAALARITQLPAVQTAPRAPLNFSDSLFVVDRGTARFLKVRAIKYIVAAGSYSEIHAADGSRSLLLQPLKNWEERLPAAQFVRAHRSHIINLEYVEKVRPLENDTFDVFIRGEALPLRISRRYAEALKKLLA